MVLVKVMGDLSERALEFMNREGIIPFPEFHLWKGQDLIKDITGARSMMSNMLLNKWAKVFGLVIEYTSLNALGDIVYPTNKTKPKEEDLIVNFSKRSIRTQTHIYKNRFHKPTEST